MDKDTNQQSDIWQLYYGVGNLAAATDSDGDGVSNALESVAGTNPMDARSRPFMSVAGTPGQVVLKWPSFAGKRYEVFTSPTLGPSAVWGSTSVFTGTDGEISSAVPVAQQAGFYRVNIDEVDTDGDGLTDWEERQIGFNPAKKNTEGYGSTTITDFTRINTALGATNTVTAVAVDPDMVENWPDAGVVAIRRTGNLNPITVNYAISGTATAGMDYQGPATGSILMGLGIDEVWLSFTPLTDASAEASETIVASLQSGTGYVVGGVSTATVTLADSPAGSVAYEEAERFLTQATFGANAAEIARVQQSGITGWIDNQFARATLLHFPLVQLWNDQIVALDATKSVGSTERTEVWWNRAMQSDSASDPLRQRVAYALSQIFVISDRVDTLDGTPLGMAGYQDMLLANTFGNYRDLLKAVTLHPTMGSYLSHLRNQKTNVSRNIYPDENYAREIMQLFSIGLWELNADGTRKVDAGGNPIPTYTNTDIASFARVFTGLSYGKKYPNSTTLMTTANNSTIIPTVGFYDGNGVWWEPMSGFDSYHDLAAKTLLRGQVLPARTASGGTATMLDIDGAMDNLFNHPNTGPFIGRLLIQRLVTSNPTDGYVGRVSAAFANNGSGVRGDMKAVIKAILLDTEARGTAYLADPAQGGLREPYLRYVALVRTMGTVPVGGTFKGFRGIDTEFIQRPYSSPSVFNFYLPDFQPLGPIKDADLVGPEFQINNGVSGLTTPNRFYSAATQTLFRLGTADETLADGTTVNAALNTVIDFAPWLDDATNAPDVMIARLDRMLTGSSLSPRSLRVISRAVRRLVDPLSTTVQATRDGYAKERFRMALYLVIISPEFSVQK